MEMAAETDGSRFLKYSGDDTEYEVPPDISSIEDLAFAGAGDLVSLTIPDSVTYIGNYVFDMCYSLRHIRLPESVDHIGTGLFHHCWSLTEIRMPEGLLKLGGEMLEGCHALTALYLPDTLRQMDRTALSGCRSIRYVYIHPSKLDILPANAANLAVLTYMEACRGRENEPAEAMISEYAMHKRRILLDLAINRRRTEAVRYMLEHGMADADAAGEYLRKAAETGRVEIAAMLLEYGKDRKKELKWEI